MSPDNVTAQEAFTRWAMQVGAGVGACVLLAFFVALIFAIDRRRRSQ